MTTHAPEEPALVLSAADVPESACTVAHACEDCACAVSMSPSSNESMCARQALLAQPDTRWTTHPGLVSVSVDSNHRAVFNPLSSRGLRVANRTAYSIVESFAQPKTHAQASDDGASLPLDFHNAFERLVAGDIIHTTDWAPVPAIDDSQLLTAWLHVTNDCNLRCPYCYVSKTNEGMSEEVGLASIDAVVNSAVKHGYPALKLKYAGGEASLRWRLLTRLHDYAQQLATRSGLRLEGVLLNNGVAVSNRLIEAIKERNIRVMISLDGVGDWHDAQRPLINGRGSFRLVEQGIDRLIKADHHPHLSITITDHNVAGLAEVVRFALERDLTFSFNLFRDNGCIANPQTLETKDQVLIDSLLKAFAMIEELMPPWSVLGTILDRGQLLQPRLRSCGVGQDYIVIDHRGQIARCHMALSKATGSVFKSDPLLTIRQNTMGVLNLSVDERQECSGCEWRYWCSGGCPVATNHATGRFDVKSPYCSVYKAIYPAALRLEGLRILQYALRGSATHTVDVIN